MTENWSLNTEKKYITFIKKPLIKRHEQNQMYV